MKTAEVPNLVKTKYGFWQYHPLPSTETLKSYYAEKYYQQGMGSYSVSYSEEEIRYFRIKPALFLRQVKRLRPKCGRQYLDVGCGEGWALDSFHKAGFKVTGGDFSSCGLQRFHPHLMEHFHQGDVYDSLKIWQKDGRSWDVVLVANVIEHVVDPEGLLLEIKKLLRPDSVLIIVAPNDFSSLHEELESRKFIDRQFWLSYPDHLSYFNKDSMLALLKGAGLKSEAIVADHPIDLNLFNDNSNYILDRTKGKATHYARVRVDNFLAGINEDKMLDLYSVFGSMGVGRDLNYFCSLA